MMNRSKSARMHLARFILILPLLAIVLLAFRSVVNNEKRSVSKIISVIDDSDIPKMITDTTPVHQTEEQVKNTKQIEHLEAIGHNWTITLKDGSVEKYDLNNTADKKAFVKKYGEMKVPKPPVPAKPPQPASPAADPAPVKEPSERTVIGKPAPTPPTPPAAPAAPNFVISGINGTKPLVIFNDVEFEGGMEELNKVRPIDPNDIKEINVLKDKTAIDIYGEKGKNGVIIIYTKDYKLRPITVVGKPAPSAPVKSDPSLEPVTVVGKSSSDGAVIITGTGNTSGSVGTGSVSNSGSAGKFSVSSDRVTITDMDGEPNEKLPLGKYTGTVIVDGKNYTAAEFKKLNLSINQIESMELLKKTESHDKKDVNGVIIIKTKKNQ